MKKILLFSICLFIRNVQSLGDNLEFNAPPVVVMVEGEEIQPDPIRRKAQLNRSIVKLRNESRKFDKNRIIVGIILMAGGISVGLGSGFDTTIEQFCSISLMLVGYKLFSNGLSNKPKRDQLDNAIRERAYLQSQQELIEQV